MSRIAQTALVMIFIHLAINFPAIIMVNLYKYLVKTFTPVSYSQK